MRHGALADVDVVPVAVQHKRRGPGPTCASVNGILPPMRPRRPPGRSTGRIRSAELQRAVTRTTCTQRAGGTRVRPPRTGIAPVAGAVDSCRRLSQEPCCPSAAIDSAPRHAPRRIRVRCRAGRRLRGRRTAAARLRRARGRAGRAARVRARLGAARAVHGGEPRDRGAAAGRAVPSPHPHRRPARRRPVRGRRQRGVDRAAVRRARLHAARARRGRDAAAPARVDDRRHRARLVVGRALSGSGERHRLRHRERAAHPGGRTRGDRAEERRRDPCILCRSSRARRRRFPARPTGNGCRPTGRASIAASARNTAARSMRTWRSRSWPSRPPLSRVARRATPAGPRTRHRCATARPARLRVARGCHAVLGTDAAGDAPRSHARRVAPAARGRHARQHPDNLRRWIAHAQQIKPDALMPSIALAARRRRSRRVSRDPALNGGCRWPSPATRPPPPVCRISATRRPARRTSARSPR